MATNLDTGASVTFGAPGHDHVPISRAIEASSALPGLFPPVEIDGEHYVDGALNKTLHASVALDEGVSLLFCVNPLVPFDARSTARHAGISRPKLNQGGLPLVLGQTFRAIIHSRMKVGMEKYARQYPDAEIMLFEPDAEDADMFFANIFSYRQRKRLCALAFDRTRQNLLARADVLDPSLSRHRMTMRMDRLGDPARGIADALNDPRPLHAQPRGNVRRTARDLHHTLGHLERWLASAHYSPRRSEGEESTRLCSDPPNMPEKKRPRRTPERILETSLALFNRFGVPHITTADIADEMNISPGNLYYHFRNKDDIIGALYGALEVEITPLLSLPTRTRRRRRGSLVAAAPVVRAHARLPVFLS